MGTAVLDLLGRFNHPSGFFNSPSFNGLPSGLVKNTVLTPACGCSEVRVNGQLGEKGFQWECIRARFSAHCYPA